MESHGRNAQTHTDDETFANTYLYHENLEPEDAGDKFVDGASEVLDPANSSRRFYLDHFTGLEREIWRPGDGDGDQATDYYDRVGLPLPLKQRWRLFQTDIGPIDASYHPPRFVILDDFAASAILRSDIPKSKLTQNWPHDFGGGGKIRARRPHRGRSAIKDTTAVGNAKYYTTTSGTKKEVYAFTGEEAFTPVLYRYERRPANQNIPRKRKSEHPDDYNPRGHGHNQFTPKDMMVKYGAPSFSKKDKSIRAPRINAFLTQDAPRAIPVGRMMYEGIGESARIAVQREAEKRKQEAAIVAEEESRQRRARLYEGDGRDVSAEVHTHPAVDEFTNLPYPDVNSDDTFLIDQLNGLGSIPVTSFIVENLAQGMSLAQRSTVEHALAVDILKSLRSQDDVIRLAVELSRAKVKITEQAHEISSLQDDLVRS